MPRWVIAVAVIAGLVVLTGAGRFWLHWRRTSQASIRETRAGYDAASTPATLAEALATAHQALDEIEQRVRDYSAVIVKEVQSGNQLVKTVMFAKIRQKPFSVYLYFFSRNGDSGVTGRQVIYVQGRNHDKLLVRIPGLVASHLGWIRLDPRGYLAMSGERHPIMDIGLANLCRELIHRGESIRDPSQAVVKEYRLARINTRACSLLEIAYPAHEAKIGGYLARVFVDNQWGLPLRVEAYELPLDGSQGPRLIEQYTYLDLRLNNGYSDADFDPNNAQYNGP